MKDDDIIKWFDGLKISEKIEILEKIKTKYESMKYIHREYRLGYEPRTPLYNLLLEYARRYRDESPISEDEIFTVEKYYLFGGYTISLLQGQGSAIIVRKEELEVGDIVEAHKFYPGFVSWINSEDPNEIEITNFRDGRRNYYNIIYSEVNKISNTRALYLHSLGEEKLKNLSEHGYCKTETLKKEFEKNKEKKDHSPSLFFYIISLLFLNFSRASLFPL